MQFGSNASTRPTIIYDLGIKLVNEVDARGKKIGKDMYAPPIEQAMSVYVQYILAKAGLREGGYTSWAEMKEGTEKLKAAKFDNIRRSSELSRKRDQLVLYFEGSCSFRAFDSIRIQNFSPDMQKLEALLNSNADTAELWASALEEYYKPTSSQKHAPVHPTARNQDA